MYAHLLMLLLHPRPLPLPWVTYAARPQNAGGEVMFDYRV